MSVTFIFLECFMGLYLRPRKICTSAVVDGTYGGQHVYLFGRYWQISGHHYFHWLGKRRRLKRGVLIDFLHRCKHRFKRDKANVSIADLVTPNNKQVFIYTDQGLVAITLNEEN